MTDKTFEKYKLVISEWLLKGATQTDAYMRFYPKASKATADANFRKILENTRIQEFIKNTRQEIAERNKMDIDEAVKILTDMARFDISECYDENGNFKSIHDIPKETRLAIEGLDTQEIRSEGVVVAEIKKLKVSSRRLNVIEILKVLGGYEKDNEQQKPIVNITGMEIK